MPDMDEVIEAIGALFIIYIFAAIVVPALGEATNTNTVLFTVALIMVGAGVVFSLFRSRR